MALHTIIRAILLSGLALIVGVIGWHYAKTGDAWTMFPKLSRNAKRVCLVGAVLCAVAIVLALVNR